MEVEGTDFDSTTEEGQVDINDEEYDAWTQGAETDPLIYNTALENKYGSRWKSFKASLNRMWQSKNRRSPVPEYLELQNMNEQGATARETVEWATQELRQRYPRFEAYDIRLTERGNKVLISVRDMRHAGANSWTKPQVLFDDTGSVKVNVERLRGFREATRSALERLETLNERVALERRVEGLRETLEEREADYMRQNRLLLDAQKRELDDKNQLIVQMREQMDKALRERDQAQKAFDLALQDLDMSQEEAKNLHVTIAASLEERRQLVAEINIKEEQIRQRDQAIEDLEGQIEQQQEIINDQTRPEEERGAAQRESETLQVRLAKLRAQKDNLEKELGLTTKEKPKHCKSANGHMVISLVSLILYAIYRNLSRIVYSYL
ncbi:golgin subfamily A member 6-like protein 22 [Actinia tenebrosa]|uniref:Golgin subfamily A member 6-like protein 22 n=1 Tax=Actinia tenebrosa TaxID=6105 RepID=A0A6P8J8W4_ACTTE|nr:golgin subfamily A member 6-like protein 22 [Actinia tenebrosa]